MSQAPLRWSMPITICFLAMGNVFLLAKLSAKDTAHVRPAEVLMNYPHKIKKATVAASNEALAKDDMGGRVIRTNSLIVYNHDPDAFADAFAHCSFTNTNCKIHYHHVQKTGGSRLASRLYPVLSNGKKYSSRKWCCQDEMMQRVSANVSHYCEHNKFGIYEVTAPQYSSVIQSCIDYNNAKHQKEDGTSNGPNEIIGLMTIREPIQLTLSQLHHQCNKNFKLKSPHEQKICRSCNFLKNQTYFMEYVKQTNMVYLEIAHEIPRLLSMFDRPIAEHRNEIVEAVHRMMILDQADLDPFFKSLESRLPQGLAIPEGRGNEEQTNRCYFGVTSHMMKALRPSLEIYRYLTSGQVWQPESKRQST